MDINKKIKMLCEDNNIQDIRKFTMFYMVMIHVTNSYLQRIYDDESVVNCFITDSTNLVNRLIMEVKAPELLQVARDEGMNVMSLYNNIKGTLQSATIKDTAMIYAVKPDSVRFVKDYEL